MRVLVFRSAQLLVLFCFLPASSSAQPNLLSLTSCLSHAALSNFTSRSASAYTSLLYFSLQNLRFAQAGVPTPDLLIFPQSAGQVQNALLCSLNASYQVRVRSGGHSYEGLSSVGTAAFVIIDLTNMRSVSVDAASKSAWVEAGATLGEIYYGIAQASLDYGFPAGFWPTVGIGGHVSGGGLGFLARKYGTAADNVIDALLVDARGRLLDRESMGEDVFWALRGGGGGTWGIVVAWHLQLVSVPSAVTTFKISRTGKHALSELIYRWQAIAPTAPPELSGLAIYIAGFTTGNATEAGAIFYGQYLGTLSETSAVMSTIYPELNLGAGDCKEGKWIDAVVNLLGWSSKEELMSRDNTAYKGHFKAKSDYVRKAITKEVLEGAIRKLEENAGKGYMAFSAWGGEMERIGRGAIAFPHRGGNLYEIQYQAIWEGGSDAEEGWMRELYEYMEPFVSESPRAAYVNYIDMELGMASSYAEAEASWGQSYFLGNFPRLARIKSLIDPFNVFNHPQSIPPLYNTGALDEGSWENSGPLDESWENCGPLDEQSWTF